MAYDPWAWHRAALAWLLAGVYQFETVPELSFASWNALAFFSLGTATAGAVFSWLDYVSTEAVVKVITEYLLSSYPEIGSRRLRLVGQLLALLPPILAFILGISGAQLLARS